MNSTITIAIAEDHALVRNGFSNLINQYTPHKVIVEAEHGAELIEKIGQLPFVPNVSLIDISMPVLDGYDTTIALRKLYPEMKLLALTMATEEYSIIRMILNGVNGYLLKNCTIEELSKAISSVHISGYYHSKIANAKTFLKAKNEHLLQLTEKELRFLRLCCSELSYAKIAEVLCVSVRTVEGYQKSVTEKLNIHTRNGLVLFAAHAGLEPVKKMK